MKKLDVLYEKSYTIKKEMSVICGYLFSSI